MQPFLQQGEIAGKIACPNPKCNAKVGSFDWTGVPCGCGEWITPVSAQNTRNLHCLTNSFLYQGFCIHRSKVDEIAS